MNKEQENVPHYIYEDRLATFLKAIKNYQKTNLQKINTRYDNEQRQQIGKIKNDASRKNEEDFKKLEDNVKVAQKIFKSRKLNDCRMREMKVRFDMMRIQEQAKTNLLKLIQNVTTYKIFLKQLIKQGLIKLLEENIQIHCIKSEEKTVEQVIRECQQEFNDLCEVETKLQINKIITCLHKISLELYRLLSKRKLFVTILKSQTQLLYAVVVTINQKPSLQRK